MHFVMRFCCATSVGIRPARHQMLNALVLLFLSATANAASLSLDRPLRLRGGRAPANDLGQAIMLTSGSLVMLGGGKVVVDGQKKSSEQERDSTTLLGLSMLGLGACKLASLATGSEEVFARVNALPLAVMAVLSHRREQSREQKGLRRGRSLLFHSLRVLTSIYTYVGWVRPWEGYVPRSIGLVLQQVSRAAGSSKPRLELPAHLTASGGVRLA